MEATRLDSKMPNYFIQIDTIDINERMREIFRYQPPKQPQLRGLNA